MKKTYEPLTVRNADGESLFVVEPGLRYNLEALARLAQEERAFDEGLHARVTQEDIRKLIDRRKKKRG
jgi:hypothetical protein